MILSLTLDLETTQGKALDWFIWIVFVIDYTVRILNSDNNWQYFKDHPLDFIAILPFDQLLRSMRIVRLVRILRLIMILNRRFSFFDQMLKKYKIDNLIISVVAILFLAALPMRHIEPSFDSYADALWWAIVTMTTVGYGDLYPETTVGRLIASVLMLIGIGIIGLVTGTVASIFTRSKDELLPKELLDVKRMIGNYPSLDRTDYDYMIHRLEQLRDVPKDDEPPEPGGTDK